MIQLKRYQIEVLDSLRKFLKRCSQTRAAATAFHEATLDEETGKAVQYFPVNIAGLSELPYVCIRVPTGGGKTLLACHAAGIAMKELVQADRAVVLWLVPSNAILDQTAAALRDVRHPYRRALEMECGTVDVITIDEAKHLSRATVDGQTVVIVSTIQSFRVEDITSRKVYSENGSLLEHFVDVPPDRRAELDKRTDESPIPSLANVLKLRRPIVIVDEAHNARTDLSFAALASVSPSCIIEFTATPAKEENPSNILHLVTAAQLYADHMIKLPLRVITQGSGEKDQLISDSVALRSDLEKLADDETQKTGEYIRPILLIQAERVDACLPLRDRLVTDFNVPREQIKISTGTLEELKDVADISSPQCSVRVVITVQRLREGWDCPFAYVLCSLKETRSATAIEQIVGRILRLPNAKEKRHPELNLAYAFTSGSISEVLTELTEALERNGFTGPEAERFIIPVSRRLPLAISPETIELDTKTEIDAALADSQATHLSGKVQFNPATGALTVLAPLSENDERTVQAWAITPDAKEKISEAVNRVREAHAAFETSRQTASFFELKADFFVPLLAVREGDSLFPFDSTPLLEHPWRLSEKDATLENYNPLDRQLGKEGEVKVTETGSVSAKVLEKTDFITKLHKQVLDFGPKPDWTFELLVNTLDHDIEHKDIPLEESMAFIRKAVRGVMARLGISDIDQLALDRFRMRDAIEKRIDEHRKKERDAAFQSFLVDTSPLVVDYALGVDFSKMIYAPKKWYEGAFIFQKHYFPKVGDLKDGEECECAKFIDDLPEAKFWVRNLPKYVNSFRLRTTKDWFYPDFVCKLTDNRILVVEYKGGHLYPGAEEERSIGKAWEDRTEGRGLFVMPTQKKFSVIKAKIGDVPNPDDFRLA